MLIHTKIGIFKEPLSLGMIPRPMLILWKLYKSKLVYYQLAPYYLNFNVENMNYESN